MNTELNQQESSSNVDIGQKFFEYRDYTPIPLILLLFYFATPSVGSATLGTLLIIFGELCRIYAVAFIGTVSRTRSSSTGHNLITTGPFAWVRNPLYVANFFIVFGITIFGGKIWLVGLTTVLFFVQYHFIIQYEQATLISKFGDQYVQYLKDVPAWVPKKAPKLSEMEWPDTFTPALKSEKRTLTAIIVILAILILLAK